jgi:hypothetical protein
MSNTIIKLVSLRDMPEVSRLVVKCATDIKPCEALPARETLRVYRGSD